MLLEKYRVADPTNFSLSDYSTDDEGGLDKDTVREQLMPANIKRMKKLQECLYAENRKALLIVLQAMDAAGKDGIIRHVMAGLNPQGTKVTPFKQPSVEELDHDYMWRIHKAIPPRGEIGIFNRSHYEEVIVTRVRDLLPKQMLPPELVDDQVWQNRFRQINAYERYLAENGIYTIKFFLYISKEEQRNRLLSRLDEPDKNWKFSVSDIEEREHWDDYHRAYEEMIQATATETAPWYVIPADRKWFARYLVSEIVRDTLENMNLVYPDPSPTVLANMDELRQHLLNN
ncbi:MAG: polyphosphate kinase 2 family protein [Clostridiaceae bacterium]|nr:polyphosphate kinase 2 family protein [Clostridiaceae bacterium]